MQQSLGLMPHLAAQVGAIADYLVASLLHHRTDRVVPIGDQVGPPGQLIGRQSSMYPMQLVDLPQTGRPQARLRSVDD